MNPPRKPAPETLFVAVTATGKPVHAALTADACAAFILDALAERGTADAARWRVETYARVTQQQEQEARA